jgi:predicted porin
MKIKLMAVSVAVAGVCSMTQLAHAQSRVTLYGNVDGGVAVFNNVGGARVSKFEGGSYIPNLFGLRGSEDLGGGTKVVMNLESGFLLDSGSLVVPGQLFTRAATVGLQNESFGTVTLGNQPSFMFDILSPYSTGYLAGSFFSFHQGNFDELANTFQVKNSVKYASASFGGMTFGVQYGFGEQPGNSAAGRTYAYKVQYKSGPFSIGAAYANENDRFIEFANLVGLKSMLGTPLPAAGIVANNVTNWGLGGSYASGDWLLHGLFTQSKINIASGRGKARTVDLGANYSISKNDTLGLGASVENFDGGRWTTLTATNTYSFSKTTSVYQQLIYQKAAGSNAVAAILGAGQSSGRSQLGLVAGVQHWF